jgi:hypothetical protein
MTRPRPGRVARDEDVWRRVAHDLKRAEREAFVEASERLAGGRLVEVCLDDAGSACLQLLLEQEVKQRVHGPPQTLRPLDVARAERLEKHLLDRVFRDQRQREAACNRLRDRRLAGRRRSCDDDDRGPSQHGR